VKKSSEYDSLLTSVREFDKADFASLSDVEKLCTYSNVVNIMRLHACIELGPPECAGEWVHFSKSVRYSLGQLGCISLFDLEFSYLRAKLPVPTMFGGALKHFIEHIEESDPCSEFVVTMKEPSIQFGIWAGWASSPSPAPLLPITYQGTLQTAKTLYLLHQVHVKRREGVFLPRLVQWYAQDFLTNQATNEKVHASDIISYVAANLPAGSSTHAYVVNANPEGLLFAKYLFAPLVRVVQLNSVDPRHVTSFEPSEATINAMLYGEDTPSASTATQTNSDEPRFKLDERALDYLGTSSEVVRFLACLSRCTENQDAIGLDGGIWIGTNSASTTPQPPTENETQSCSSSVHTASTAWET